MVRAKEISPYGYIVKPVFERQLMEMIGAALRETESRGEGS
jgi:two-component SAPR family response regulator